MRLRNTKTLTVWAAALPFSLPMLVASGAANAADDAQIKGVVTGAEGQAIRGAIVKAMAGKKSVTRYTGADGRYQIRGLAAGTPYELTVDAFGYAIETKNVSVGNTASADFKLTPKLDITQLRSAELAYLFPDDKEQKIIYYACSDCHGLETTLHGRGMTAPAWEAFLAQMTVSRWGDVVGFAPEVIARYSPGLEKVFGPHGVLGPNSKPDLTKVKHTPLQDAALKATVTEYDIPSPRGQVHSVRVDERSGLVWYSEYDAASNHIGAFDPQTETFKQFKIELPAARAHTGAVLEDGSFIVALDKNKAATKAIRITPEGKTETYEWAGKPQGSRVVALDPTDANIVWLVAGVETWRLDLTTKQFTAYKNPAAALPENSFGAQVSQKTGAFSQGAGYDLTLDSKGTPWITQLAAGLIFRLDPATGKTQLYSSPELRSARGIAADARDNLWFGDYFGHQLGMINAKTGEIKTFRPPNPYASPYGVSIDHRRGYIWYADTAPNGITRFDPKTGEFVEYPIPTRNASVRFLGLDARGRAWYGGFMNQKLGVIDPGDEDGQVLSSRK